MNTLALGDEYLGSGGLILGINTWALGDSYVGTGG